MVYIIAEAGVNHNGDIDLAKKLVDEAALAGCDAVKFQTFKAENIVTQNAEKAQYQRINTNNDHSQFEMLQSLELTYEAHEVLLKYCNSKKIDFLSTPFDEESAVFLEKLGVEKFKIASGEITNKMLLKTIAKFNKPIILSTGMSSLGEVEEAIQWIKEEGNEDITLLHCTSNYPVKFDDVNLKAMKTLNEAFKLPVGYSDHTEGIEIPIAAVAMGACIIEKHFTLDKNMVGPDHKASLDPNELIKMVKSIRNVSKAIGDGVKRLLPSEIDTKNLVRKSIVSKVGIKKGQIITEELLTVKRPGTGIEPKHFSLIVGSIAKDDIERDSIVYMSELEILNRK